MSRSAVLSDSLTMLRRQLVHAVRYPIVLFMVGIPVVMLLLFVYVFGGTLGAGLGGVSGGRAEYLEYVLPGILLMTIAMGAQLTPIAVSMDMTEGIIARFRTMSISRSSVLAGHVLSGMLQMALSLAAVIGVALLIGYRPAGDLIGWLEAAGVLAVVTLAITWLSVACGLLTKGVETASNVGMPLMLLPFLGSGFVPTETMPAALRWFAEHQPFTAFMETLRGLLMGTSIGNEWAITLAWCAAITLAGYFLAMRLYERDPVR